jgi:hypothetical protein
MKTFREFSEQLVEATYLGKTIIIKDKGLGWHAEFAGIKTTIGVGTTPEKALNNLLNQIPDGSVKDTEDWERENRLQQRFFR